MATLIPVGILLILFSLIALISPVYSFEFSIGSHLLLGATCLGGGLLLLFPPNIGSPFFAKKLTKYNDNMKMQSNSLNLSSDNLEDDLDDDVIDKILKSILNADTSLAALQRTNPDLSKKIQSTFDLYNPQGGVFSSWARRMRGEGKGKLLEVLNKEQQLLIEQAAMFEKQVREDKKSEIEFYTFMAENALKLMEVKTKAKLNAKAFQKEMLPEHWSKVRTEQEMSDIRLKEEAEKQRLEQEKQDKETQRKLVAARNFKRNEDLITDDMRQKREKLLEEIEKIEADETISDKRKISMKMDRENEAESLRRRIAARDLKAVSDEESYIKDI